MNTNVLKNRSLRNFLLLLFGLSIPLWVIGAVFRVQLFPGFYLFQLPLAMPAVAALILLYRESGKDGVAALLKRTYDFRKIKPKIWYLPILLIYPSFGFLNYWILRLSGTSIPSPHFSLVTFLGYSTVFFLTFGEELGMTGYALDPMQQRYSALKSGLLLRARVGRLSYSRFHHQRILLLRVDFLACSLHDRGPGFVRLGL